jgi:hypothetical protein
MTPRKPYERVYIDLYKIAKLGVNRIGSLLIRIQPFKNKKYT